METKDLILYNKIIEKLNKKYENFKFYIQNPTEEFKNKIENEKFLDFDFEELEKLLNIKLRYYQKLALYFSNYYLNNEKLQEINPYKNQLAYWMATGSGKTIVMKADIINYLNYLKENGKLNSLSQIEIIITSSLTELIEQLKNEFTDFLKRIEKYFNIRLKIAIDTIQSLMNKKEYKGNILNNQFRLILADEAHIGLSSKKSAFKEFKNNLVNNINQSFMFEYSATFYEISEELKDEYKNKIIFEYSYDKFFNDFYGKDFKFGVIRADKLDEKLEIKENLKQNLDDFEKKLVAFENYNKNAYLKFQDRPLLVVVGNKVSSKKEEIKQELSDVEKFINYLIELKDIKNYKNIFHTDTKTKLYLIYNKQDDEILLGFDEEKPFGLVNIGDSKSLINILKDKVSYREVNFVKEEWKFKNIDNNASPINILIGSRKFSAGWNSFRVSQICLINFGVGRGNTIIQIFGRGVRLRGLRNDGKRQWNYVDENLFKTDFKKDLPKEFEDLKYLETLFIYSLKSTYLKNFISEKTGIFKQKIIKEKTINKTSTIKSIIIKNNFDKKKIKNIEITKDGKVIYFYDNKKDEFDINLKINLFVKEAKKLNVKEYEHYWEFIDKVEIEKYILNNKFYFELDTLKDLIINNNIIIYYDDELNVKKFEILLYKIINHLEKYIENKIEKSQKIYEFKNIEYPYDKYKVEIILKKSIANIDLYNKILYELIELIKQELDKNCKLPEINILKIASKISTNETEINIDELFKEIDISIHNPITLNPEKNKIKQKTLFENINNQNNNNIEKITISPDSLDEWEYKFLNDLNKYVKQKNLNIKVLRNIPKKGSGIIGEEGDYYPDFIIEYKENNITHIIFCDPKGIRDSSNLFKVCIAPYLIKEIQNENIKFHSFVITHTEKNKINWYPIKSLNEKDCYEYFNLLFFTNDNYIEKIFEKIKNDNIEIFLEKIKELFDDKWKEKLIYYFSLELQDIFEDKKKLKKIESFFEDINKLEINEIIEKYDLCKKIIKKNELIEMFILKYIVQINKEKYDQICNNLSSLKKGMKNFLLEELPMEIISNFIPIPFLPFTLKAIKASLEDFKRKKH